MSRRNWDIAVVGAGPAGASAALALAASGISVVVLERQPYPRYKVCGGGITGRAMRELAGIKLPVEHYCHRVELNLLDCGLSFSDTRAEPLVSMVMRDDFDAALMTAATDAGATLIDDSPVIHVEPDEAGVAITTQRGSLRASLVILADGALSPLARSRNFPDGRRMMPALEWEVPVDDRTLGRFHDTARFDFGLVTDGYAWIFPKNRHLSVGLGALDGRRSNLPQILQNYLNRLNIHPTDQILRRGSLIPVSPRRGPFARERLLLIGDAAGLTDPLTGEGITFSIRSGRLAAAAIISGELNPPAVAARYEQALQEQILTEIRYGTLLAALLYRMPAWRRWIFSRRGARLTHRMCDVITGEASYHEIFRRTSAWWRLLGIS